MSDYDHLRALYDLPTIIEQYTGQVVRGKWGIVCPMPHHVHTNNTPSLTVFERWDGVQAFSCKGNCGAEGDVIDFVGYYHQGAAYNPKDPDCVRRAIAHLQREPFNVSKRTVLRKKKRQLNPIRARLDVNQWQDALRDNDIAQMYLKQRGILSVAEQFGLGYRYIDHAEVKRRKGGRRDLPGHYISIPAFDNGSIAGVKFRRIDIHPDYDGINKDLLPIRYDSLPGSRNTVFNKDRIAFHNGPVFFPEGEFDVMLLAAAGYMAACTTTGAQGVEGIGNLDLLLTYASPVILEEPDPAGESGARKKKRLIPKARVVSTAPFRDIGQIFDERGEDGMREWIEACLKSRKDEQTTDVS